MYGRWGFNPLHVCICDLCIMNMIICPNLVFAQPGFYLWYHLSHQANIALAWSSFVEGLAAILRQEKRFHHLSLQSPVLENGQFQKEEEKQRCTHPHPNHHKPPPFPCLLFSAPGISCHESRRWWDQAITYSSVKCGSRSLDIPPPLLSALLYIFFLSGCFGSQYLVRS